MPLYTFKCPDCDFEEETLLASSELKTFKISCPHCCTFMARRFDAPVIGKPAHQMGVIMDNGQRISGHFGVSARKS